MAMPVAEFRETLVAQGYSEAMADAVIALAGAARDEAVEQAAERNGHLTAILTTRLENHEKQNETDLRSVESTIRETVASAVTALKDEMAEDRILNERRFSALREENERRFSALREENERRFSEVMSEITKMRADLERRMGEIRGDLEHRMFVLGLGLAGLIVGAAGVVIAAVAIFTGG